MARTSRVSSLRVCSPPLWVRVGRCTFGRGCGERQLVSQLGREAVSVLLKNHDLREWAWLSCGWRELCGSMRQSPQGAPRFPYESKSCGSVRTPVLDNSGVFQRGPEEVQSFPSGKTCLTYQRTKTCRAVPGRFFVCRFGSLESYLGRKPFLSCTCVPTSAVGEALSCDRLKAVEDFRSNQIPCSELLLL